MAQRAPPAPGGARYGKPVRPPDASTSDSPDLEAAPTASFSSAPADDGEDHTLTCPECSGDVRPGDSELVCRECGLVLADEEIDPGPEWRSFEDDSEESSRVGAPVSAALHDGGLSTTFDASTDGRGKQLSGSQRRKFRRLRTRHRRATKGGSKAERNRISGFVQIRRIVAELDLPKSVRDRACELFSTAHEKGLLKGSSIESYAAGAVYAACRVMAIPREIAEVTEHSSMPASKIRLAYGRMNEELGLAATPPTPREFVPRVLSCVEQTVAETVRKDALELAAQAVDRGVSVGHKPSGFAAGIIYHLSQGRITQDELADAAGVSDATVRTGYKEIEEMLEEIDEESSEDDADQEQPDVDDASNTDDGSDPQERGDETDRGIPYGQWRGAATSMGLLGIDSAHERSPLPPCPALSASPQQCGADGRNPDNPSRPEMFSRIVDAHESEEGTGSDQICSSCGDAASITIDGEAFCKDCGYSLLYLMPEPQAKRVMDVDDEAAPGAEPYRPPFPGDLGRSRMVGLGVDDSSKNPQYWVNLTKPVRVSPVETGDALQVFVQADEGGSPVIDLYYIGEDEDTDTLPNTRKLIEDNSGARLRIPPSSVEQLLEVQLGIPADRYDGSDKLLFWPQVLPDRIRLYALCFESEWEQLQEEATDTESQEPDGESEESHRASIPGGPVAGISPSAIEEAVVEWDVPADLLIAALESFATRVDAEDLDELSPDEMVEHEGRRVWTVPTSAWEPDGELDVVDYEDGVRSALRYAHNLEANRVAEEGAPELGRRLMGYDGAVLPVYDHS